MYNLPYDYSLCIGGTQGTSVHPTCEDCMRKLSPHRRDGKGQSYIARVPDIHGECKDKISVKQWEGTIMKIDLTKFREVVVLFNKEVQQELLSEIEKIVLMEKDAQRYRWLFDARTEDQVDQYSTTIANPLPQDFVLSELQCFYTTKVQVDEMIDTQMETSNET